MKQASQLLTRITKRLYPQARAMSLSAIDRVGARESTSTEKETASLVPEILDAYARAAAQAARPLPQKPAPTPAVIETHDRWKGDRDDFGPVHYPPRAPAAFSSHASAAFSNHASAAFSSGLIPKAVSKTTALSAPLPAPSGIRRMSVFGMPDYDPVMSETDIPTQKNYQTTMAKREQLQRQWIQENEHEEAEKRANLARDVARLHNHLHGISAPEAAAPLTETAPRNRPAARPQTMPASKTTLSKQPATLLAGGKPRHFTTESELDTPSVEQEKYERRQLGEQQERQARAAREQRKWQQEQQDKPRQGHAETISQERKTPASQSKG